MKTVLPAFLVLVTALIVSCAAHPQQTEASKNVLSGTVSVIGNDPFTRVALATSDSTMVVLQCSNSDDKQLRENQGKTARVTYDGAVTTSLGREVHVVKVEINTGK